MSIESLDHLCTSCRELLHGYRACEQSEIGQHSLPYPSRRSNQSVAFPLYMIEIILIVASLAAAVSAVEYQNRDVRIAVIISNLMVDAACALCALIGLFNALEKPYWSDQRNESRRDVLIFRAVYMCGAAFALLGIIAGIVFILNFENAIAFSICSVVGSSAAVLVLSCIRNVPDMQTRDSYKNLDYRLRGSKRSVVDILPDRKI